MHFGEVQVKVPVPGVRDGPLALVGGLRPFLIR
jgi:hypothetical protein